MPVGPLGLSARPQRDFARAERDDYGRPQAEVSGGGDDARAVAGGGLDVLEQDRMVEGIGRGEALGGVSGSSRACQVSGPTTPSLHRPRVR